ncbi:MAG: hypothetical protein WD059_15930 [Balneolaceae bacterium]
MAASRTMIFLLTGLFVLLSCSNTTTVEPGDDLVNSETIDNDFELGEEFQLAFEESFYNHDEKIEVRFTALLEESRCPEDVMCVWAGNANILLQMKMKSESHEVQLDTHQKLNKKEIVEAFYIKLIKLAPYPESIEYQNSAEDYTATLMVEFSD